MVTSICVGQPYSVTTYQRAPWLTRYSFLACWIRDKHLPRSTIPTKMCFCKISVSSIRVCSFSIVRGKGKYRGTLPSCLPATTSWRSCSTEPKLHFESCISRGFVEAVCVLDSACTWEGFKTGNIESRVRSCCEVRTLWLDGVFVTTGVAAKSLADTLDLHTHTHRQEGMRC